MGEETEHGRNDIEMLLLYNLNLDRMYGSFESLKGGSTLEAMEDFTGGMGEIFDLKNAPPNQFSVIKKALHKGCMLGCSIDVSI